MDPGSAMANSEGAEIRKKGKVFLFRYLFSYLVIKNAELSSLASLASVIHY